MYKNKDTIYAINHYNFFDKIVLKKRLEISNIINDLVKDIQINDALDIGTTSDDRNASSNIVIKNIKNIEKFKCISDQIVTSNFFFKTLKKSITEEFSENELYEFSSDLVISNATIEHVGGVLNQKKMIENIIKLTKKIFVITTPNRFYPIELHTKIPLIHWFPKSIYRQILKFFGLSFYANEENLNLLSINDLKNMLNNQKIVYEIKFIKLFFFKSNIIIIGKK
ncbi:hypothetical protein E5R92_03180 [Candidatus Pelagibacter giovannonii]|uniref:Methyltransferase domain-containing protein n=1 Tax=Candidatus Pelagibacter giovannonii TaxID=2563896 RepID=A0A6H1Q1J4_9PROT|nr:hypothetical protein [Candidatus Pelagibacter giovannonii]QIZ20787.1 hypothetical protein E5R92_03180 [Candidatus Pelagibacter giovannonii]